MKNHVKNPLKRFFKFCSYLARRRGNTYHINETVKNTVYVLLREERYLCACEQLSNPAGSQRTGWRRGRRRRRTRSRWWRLSTRPSAAADSRHPQSAPSPRRQVLHQIFFSSKIRTRHLILRPLIKESSEIWEGKTLCRLHRKPTKSIFQVKVY
jgi:hypothetical protein